MKNRRKTSLNIFVGMRINWMGSISRLGKKIQQKKKRISKENFSDQTGKTIFPFPFKLNYSAVMYGGFQGAPQLGHHDAERRQSLRRQHFP